MKIGVLGATGNTGGRLLTEALRRGHSVTAIVRSAAKIEQSEFKNFTVRVADFDDQNALAAAMCGHDVAINAAGNAYDGASYIPLVQRIIASAVQALGEGGRLWLFGGAAALDVPGTGKMTLEFPGIPKIFEAHRKNLEAVSETSLDWSMLCPGPMIASPNGQPTPNLRVSIDEWPAPRPAATKHLPDIFTSLAFKNSLPEMTIYYEDAAKIILDNLDCDGALSRKRVGIGLPKGEKRCKTLRRSAV